MNGPLAEQLSDIHRRMHEIAKEEGRVDYDVITATYGDLDAIAARYGLERAAYEADEPLRERIMGVSRKGKMA